MTFFHFIIFFSSTSLPFTTISLVSSRSLSSGSDTMTGGEGDWLQQQNSDAVYSFDRVCHNDGRHCYINSSHLVNNMNNYDLVLIV